MRLGLAVALVGLGTGVFGDRMLSADGKISAGASPIALNANRVFVVGGKATFLIALSSPPPLAGTTPAGRLGPGEVARAGVNLVRVGPTWTGWTRRELALVLAWDRLAVRLGVHTWVRLNAFAATQPRWRGDAHLAAIVHALTRSRSAAGIGFWQGADEPWSRDITARSLAFVYCRLTARGASSACAGEPPLDRRHLFVTILAPRGSAAELAPYRKVSDELGVDVYPVTLDNRHSPDLHEVGIWTRAIAEINRDHFVWTTLQICSIHQYNQRTGAYVLPSSYQERYMLYDAIINGARGVAFFGGNIPHCWNRVDRRYGWNWTFWNRTLSQLIEQIGSHSPLAPALDNPASTHFLATSDPGTEAISRFVSTRAGTQVWVIAARSTTGIAHVSISGIPSSAKTATVYRERRTVRVADETLRDTFRQWQVHVYELRTAPA